MPASSSVLLRMAVLPVVAGRPSLALMMGSRMNEKNSPQPVTPGAEKVPLTSRLFLTTRMPPSAREDISPSLPVRVPDLPVVSSRTMGCAFEPM